jgi:hypothetical protein
MNRERDYSQCPAQQISVRNMFPADVVDLNVLITLSLPATYLDHSYATIDVICKTTHK